MLQVPGHEQRTAVRGRRVAVRTYYAGTREKPTQLKKGMYNPIIALILLILLGVQKILLLAQ